ncbi:MAG TPA: 2-dehydropantoate 2-reductase [Smithellaceae bacterium]|nr:2-dehydropantoate 2-reductase [Smithellaceae bacterium]
MRIGIIGMGGVGGYFGGKLAREYAGKGKHEIIFVCRGEHLAEIKKNGLKLFTKEGDYSVRPDLATDNPAAAGVFDLAFFSVKSYHLEKAARDFSAGINQNTIVIPLLNGVDIAERLRKSLSAANILQGCVYISSSVAKPGTVRQTDGSCQMLLGTDDGSAKSYQHVLDILLEAKINAELSDKISIALWTKYILICPLAGITAATGKTFGGVMENADLKNQLRKMMQEVRIIAAARKVVLPENIVEQTLDKIGRFAYDTKTSMQVDRERGNKMEIDIFTAYIRKAGRELGIPTPWHNEIFNFLSGK